MVCRAHPKAFQFSSACVIAVMFMTTKAFVATVGRVAGTLPQQGSEPEPSSRPPRRPCGRCFSSTLPPANNSGSRSVPIREPSQPAPALGPRSRTGERQPSLRYWPISRFIPGGCAAKIDSARGVLYEPSTLARSARSARRRRNPYARPSLRRDCIRQLKYDPRPRHCKTTAHTRSSCNRRCVSGRTISRPPQVHFAGQPMRPQARCRRMGPARRIR